MPAAVDALVAGNTNRPRADAQRNFQRLVAAARAAVDEQGLGVTTREIAHRAGVGLGTLYRRVPSLDALVTAILADAIDEMTARAAGALDDPDPWRAFADFAEVFVQLRASSRGLHAALSGGAGLGLDEHVAGLQEALRRLICRAQAAGSIRADLDWPDVLFSLASAIPAVRTLDLAARADQWRRNLAIIITGLRAG
ncbi:MAG TPA: TetR/AcrR family transcriptional regulator [Streptosporangiaceae bacterium]|nr:TetR/AcrR family transcriptional regulator [Streptosporangiaceae bacterium]